MPPGNHSIPNVIAFETKRPLTSEISHLIAFFLDQWAVLFAHSLLTQSQFTGNQCIAPPFIDGRH